MTNMCFLCLKDNPFANKNPLNIDLKRARAQEIKELIREAEAKQLYMCYIGDATIALLKKEQYELAKDL